MWDTVADLMYAVFLAASWAVVIGTALGALLAGIWLGYTSDPQNLRAHVHAWRERWQRR